MTQPQSDPLSGRILTIRGQRVILDSDLARLYGVPTFRFNEAVKRNAGKFPEDFRFQLTRDEHDNLKSQSVMSKAEGVGGNSSKRNSSQFAMSSRRGASYRPWAFTEHGAVMAANVLRSSTAVQMSVYVVRAFVAQREALATNQSVLRRLAEIDKTLLEHDGALQILWKRLQPLLAPPPEPPKKEIGFHTRMKKH